MTFEPRQFQVNEAPVATEADDNIDVLALMDAASCFILSTEFIRTDSAEPSQLESKRLLMAGQSHSQQLPKKLIIPINQAADILSEEAERLGIAVARAPEEELSILVREARDGFREHVSGDRFQ